MRSFSSASCRLFSLRRHQRMKPSRVTLPSWSFSRSPPSAKASWASLQKEDQNRKHRHQHRKSMRCQAPPSVSSGFEPGGTLGQAALIFGIELVCEQNCADMHSLSMELAQQSITVGQIAGNDVCSDFVWAPTGWTNPPFPGVPSR